MWYNAMAADELHPFFRFGKTFEGEREKLILSKGHFWDRPSKDLFKRDVQFEDQVFLDGLDDRVTQLLQWVDDSVRHYGENRVLL